MNRSCLLSEILIVFVIRNCKTVASFTIKRINISSSEML